MTKTRSLRKIENHEKIGMYPPNLTVSYPPPYGDIQILMRSDKFIEPPDEEGLGLVNYVQGYERGTVLDTTFLFDMVKTMMHKVTEDYYNNLLEAEIYELPEMLKNVKVRDTIITVSTKQSFKDDPLTEGEMNHIFENMKEVESS